MDTVRRSLATDSELTLVERDRERECECHLLLFLRWYTRKNCPSVSTSRRPASPPCSSASLPFAGRERTARGVPGLRAPHGAASAGHLGASRVCGLPSEGARKTGELGEAWCIYLSISLLFINQFIYLFIYQLVSLLRSRGKGIVYSPQWSEIVVLNGESRDFTASASCEFLLPLHGSVFEDNEAFGDE